MRTRRIAALLLAAFVSSSVPMTSSRPAHAQGADDPVTVQARQRFKEGVDAYDKGKYEEARLSFLQAYALKKHPAVLLNLAQSTARAGHPLEAAKYFKQYLKESTTATPQQRSDAEKGLSEARQKLGRIEVVAPSGTEITLDDGERVGTAPLGEAVDVEPGPHTVRSPSESVKVVAVVGQKVEAKLGGSSAAAAAAAPPPPAGAVGGAAAAPNETAAPAEPGDKPAASSDTGTKHTSIFAPPKNMIPVYIGGGLTVAGIAGAIIFAVFKADAQSSADDVATQIRGAASARGIPSQGVCSSTDPQIQADFGNACTTLRENNDRVDTNAAIANVSIVVAGVAAVGTIAYWLVADKKEEGGASAKSSPRPSRPIVTPFGGFGTGGIALSAQF